MNDKFETFEDLKAYQVAREFRKAMYQIAKKLPETEKYGLANQIRRAAVSLTNNIAEGHGRFHYPDQIKFMLQARGSLQELIDDLNVCDDERYADQREVMNLKAQGLQVAQLLGGYMRHLRNRKCGQSTVMRDEPANDNFEDLGQPFSL